MAQGVAGRLISILLMSAHMVLEMEFMPNSTASDYFSKMMHLNKGFLLVIFQMCL